ncbi:hypothetical protein [Poriferisphaera sp. WC338]|uniref:hypothetical protein n=1 Tax=Poriferisphaera sp. WC338 TaxID=3425129 RepID=UPI003D819F5F
MMQQLLTMLFVTTIGLSLVLQCKAEVGAGPSAEAVTLLAVDDGWVEKNEGMSLSLHEAVRHEANPVLKVRAGKHDSDRAAFNQWVLLENGIFRMWYTGFDGSTWSTCYAESVDGVNWERPNVGLFNYKGSKDNNIVIPGFNLTAPFRDDYDPDPNRRYKAALARPLPKGVVDRWEKSVGGKKPGVGSPSVGGFAYSADGINWTTEENDFPLPLKREAASLMYYQGKYFCYGQMSNGDYPEVERWSRCLSTSYSDDFKHWKLAKKAGFYFDPKYGGRIQTHGTLGYQIYDQAVVGAYGIFYNNGELLDHETDLILIVSNDGMTWRKPDKHPFTTILRRAPRGAWDGSFLTQANILNNGRETYLYYAGKESLANLFYGEQQTGLATWRLDGYGFQAPAVGWKYTSPVFKGALTSKPIEVKHVGQQLYMNVRIKDLPGHEVRVELRDAANKPIQGYALADCDPMTVDSVGFPISWKGESSLDRVMGQKVKVHLEVKAENPKRWQKIRVNMPYFYAAYLDMPKLWLDATHQVYGGRGMERIHFQDPDRMTLSGIEIYDADDNQVTLTSLDDSSAVLQFEKASDVKISLPGLKKCMVGETTIEAEDGSVMVKTDPDADVILFF